MCRLHSRGIMIMKLSNKYALGESFQLNVTYNRRAACLSLNCPSYYQRTSITIYQLDCHLSDIALLILHKLPHTIRAWEVFVKWPSFRVSSFFIITGSPPVKTECLITDNIFSIAVNDKPEEQSQ